MTRPRWTIGRLMLWTAGLAVVMAIATNAPALFLPLGWLGSGWVGFLIGRRWPELALPVAIVTNLAALSLGAGAILGGPGHLASWVIPTVALGVVFVLVYPSALGCMLGSVGRPLPKGADRIDPVWFVGMAVWPCLVVVWVFQKTDELLRW